MIDQIVMLISDIYLLFYCCFLFLPHKQWLTVAVGVAMMVVLGMGLLFWHHCVVVTQLDPLD